MLAKFFFLPLVTAMAEALAKGGFARVAGPSKLLVVQIAVG